MSDNVSKTPSGNNLNRTGRIIGTHTVSTAELIADKLCLIQRAVIVILIVGLFLPSLNPAKITSLINKNMSMFTCGVSYDSLISNMKRPLSKGWIEESAMVTLHTSCLVFIIGSVAAAAGGCMSLGNNKLKKLGCIVAAVGGAVEGCSMLGINSAYKSVAATPKPEKVEPVFSQYYYLFIIGAAVVTALSFVIFFMLPKVDEGEGFEMESKYRLFLMMLPILVLSFVFAYLPLLGWRYAFYDYKSGETLTSDKFVGLKWFTQLFRNAATKRDILRVIKNTLAMSALGIGTSWVAMVFAIFLSEVKNTHFRRFVQTFTTIPNFISWVLVYAIALAIFSTDGFINTLKTSLGDPTATNYLLDTSHMWLKMLAWGMWKGLGWSAIIYIAAITGIDPTLYEAATVDGAGRFDKMWYITVPELIPTYMVLLLMSIANILTNGMDQYLVFSNAVNKDMIEVLDLYVYNLGIGSGLIPMSTVIGMVKSVISVILLFTANGISKAVRGESIF